MELLCKQQAGSPAQTYKPVEHGVRPSRLYDLKHSLAGIIETRDMGDRAFAHTIVMKKAQDAGSYVVLHDIFVFLDDITPHAPLATVSFPTVYHSSIPKATGLRPHPRSAL